MAKWKTSTLAWFVGLVILLSVSYPDSASAGEMLPARVLEAIRVANGDDIDQRLLSDTPKEDTYRNQIKCQGNITYPFLPFSAINLPDLSPEEEFRTVLSLCASSNLGEVNLGGGVIREGVSLGGSLKWNAEAYCAWKLSPPTVIFSKTPDKRDFRLYDFWSQVAILCQARCRCLSDVEKRHIADTAIPSQEVIESESDPYRMITRDPPRAVVRPLIQFGDFRPIDAYVYDAALHNMPGIGPALEVLHIYPGVPTNLLKCTGLLPPTALPSPFTDYEYTSLQSLCASLHDGGATVGNLGGMCLKQPELFIFSAIHMHPGFARYADGYAFAASIWCILHCSCNGQDPKKDVVLRDENGVENVYEIDSSNGGLVVRAQGQNGQSVEETIVEPDSRGSSSGGGQQQSCASNLDTECVSDTHITGPRLFAFMNSHISRSGPYRFKRDRRKVRLPPFDHFSLQNLEDASTSQPDPRLNTCGGECSSNQDCASEPSKSCRCFYDVPHQIAQKYGLAAVYTQFICLPIAAVSMTLSTKSKLGGRDSIFGLSCACNSTYVSRSCCDSFEGRADGLDTYNQNILDM